MNKYKECMNALNTCPYGNKSHRDNKELFKLNETIKQALKIASKQEKKKTKSGCPDGVTQETWDDFVKQRKRQKADITPTALKLIANQAKQANWSLEEALQEICARGWKSFKAGWVDAKPKEANKEELPEWLHKLSEIMNDSQLRWLKKCTFDGKVIKTTKAFERDYIKQHLMHLIERVYKGVEVI